MEEGKVIACHTVESWNEQIKRGQDSNKLIVVDFCASWCGPCKVISPFFSGLARKHQGVIFLKVDVDELKEIAEEWGVEAMPTFVFVRNCKNLETVVGAKKDILREALDIHVAVPVSD